MSKQSVLSRPITLDAVVEPGLISGDGLQSVRLIHSGGELMAWSGNHMEPANNASVLTATVHVNPFGRPLGLTPIIEWIQWRPDMPVTASGSGRSRTKRFFGLIRKFNSSSR